MENCRVTRTYFPVKTTVRYALESAKKTRLIEGRAGRERSRGKGKLDRNIRNISEGWQFTPLGAEWIQKNKERISKLLCDEQSISKAIPSYQAKKFDKKD